MLKLLPMILDLTCRMIPTIAVINLLQTQQCMEEEDLEEAAVATVAVLVDHQTATMAATTLVHPGVRVATPPNQCVKSAVNQTMKQKNVGIGMMKLIKAKAAPRQSVRLPPAMG